MVIPKPIVDSADLVFTEKSDENGPYLEVAYSTTPKCNPSDTLDHDFYVYSNKIYAPSNTDNRGNDKCEGTFKYYFSTYDEKSHDIEFEFKIDGKIYVKKIFKYQGYKESDY